MRKFTTRGICECPDGPWGVPTKAGPADKHDPPLRGGTLWCQGPTMDGETRFLNLNFALKDPGTRALPFMHPWKEHSFLRRRSWCMQKICASSIPKTNEDLPPWSYLPCSREEEQWQSGMANYGLARCTKATTPGHWQIGTGKNTCSTPFWPRLFFYSGFPWLPVATTGV